MFWQGRGGSIEHAISGIDIALWDLFGKITNQPVSRLLGGNYRTQIKPYGSLLFDEVEPLKEKLKAAMKNGFKAIKLGWKPFGRRDFQTDEQLVRTARETIGPDVELMIDAGGSEAFWPHGYKWALRTAQMLANYNVVWFEEALPPMTSQVLVNYENILPCLLQLVRCLPAGKASSPFLKCKLWMLFNLIAPSVAG